MKRPASSGETWFTASMLSDTLEIDTALPSRERLYRAIVGAFAATMRPEWEWSIGYDPDTRIRLLSCGIRGGEIDEMLERKNVY